MQTSYKDHPQTTVSLFADPTAHLGQQQQQQQVVLMRQHQQQNNNNNGRRRHTQHFGDFDYKLYAGGMQQQQQRMIQTRPQITKL